MKKLLKVCRDIRTIPESDFAEAEEMAAEQAAYLSPLKMATTGRQHALAEYNRIVITKVKELKLLIDSAASLAKR